MLYKIFHDPSHPLHSELPNLFYHRRVTKGSLCLILLSIPDVSFIPVATKLWNELPSMIVEDAELQKFRLGANLYLLGVDGL